MMGSISPTHTVSATSKNTGVVAVCSKQEPTLQNLKFGANCTNRKDVKQKNPWENLNIESWHAVRTSQGSFPWGLKYACKPQARANLQETNLYSAKYRLWSPIGLYVLTYLSYTWYRPSDSSRADSTHRPALICCDITGAPHDPSQDSMGHIKHFPENQFKPVDGRSERLKQVFNPLRYRLAANAATQTQYSASGGWAVCIPKQVF